MPFKEKIDKILAFNELGINSVSGLEDYVKVGRGVILDAYRQDKEPGPKTVKKIKGLPRLNKEWYENGDGDVFEKKPTLGKENGEDDVFARLKNLILENENLIAIVKKQNNSLAIYESYIKVLEEKIETKKLSEIKPGDNENTDQNQKSET